jgi:hypothetical protein
MMQNPLLNNINPEFKRETNPAVKKTLFPRINVEEEHNSSSHIS